MLTARRLKVRCPSKTIVHTVDLDFASGIHCIIGTSGAGKTTMLEALSGRSKHDVSGNVLLNDLPVTHKDIQYIPTMPVLFDFMTSREILTFFLHFYPVSKKKLGHLLNIILDVDVDVRLDRLSSGQRKRIQFIILALKECKCRFIDEPFSNMSSGDVQTVMRAIVSLQHISPETITIIITHHHFEFETFAVQRIMLNDGHCSSEQYSPSGMQMEELQCNPLTEQLYAPPCGTWSKMRQVLLSHWLFQNKYWAHLWIMITIQTMLIALFQIGNTENVDNVQLFKIFYTLLGSNLLIGSYLLPLRRVKYEPTFEYHSNPILIYGLIISDMIVSATMAGIYIIQTSVIFDVSWSIEAYIGIVLLGLISRLLGGIVSDQDIYEIVFGYTFIQLSYVNSGQICEIRDIVPSTMKYGPIPRAFDIVMARITGNQTQCINDMYSIVLLIAFVIVMCILVRLNYYLGQKEGRLKNSKLNREIDEHPLLY